MSGWGRRKCPTFFCFFHEHISSCQLLQVCFTVHAASLRLHWGNTINVGKNRDDGEQLKSLPQRAYRPAELRLWLQWRGVEAAAGELRVKKTNKNKLHNIYIPPSLVTYFTQKPWELIIRPCCQLSLIDFPSRFLLFFFFSPKWYKLYHSSIMQGRTTLGRPGFTMHILAEEGRRASVSVCEREIDSCVCLGFSFLPLWNIRDCFFLTDA